MTGLEALRILLAAPSAVFTTRDFGMLAGVSPAHASQILRRLAEKQAVLRLREGLWAVPTHPGWSVYAPVPYLALPHSTAVSLLSALHLHGMIEQIPHVTTLVSTAHSRVLTTPVGTYAIHQLAPDFFKGYEWYGGKGSFLIATPAKALADILYLSTRRGCVGSHLPELTLSPAIKRETLMWLKTLKAAPARVAAMRRLS